MLKYYQYIYLNLWLFVQTFFNKNEKVTKDFSNFFPKKKKIDESKQSKILKIIKLLFPYEKLIFKKKEFKKFEKIFIYFNKIYFKLSLHEILQW